MSNKQKQPIVSLSIRTYAVLIVLIGACLFGGYGWLAFNQLERLKSEEQSRISNLAKDEIENTFKLVEQRVRSISKKFSNWDETVQQLTLPTYYSYWRDSRAKQAGFVTSYMESIEIYDKNGNILAKSPHKDMPSRISESDQTLGANLYVKEIYIFQQTPIVDKFDNQNVSGYVILKFDLISALKSIQKFNYVDPNTVSILESSKRVIQFENFIENLSYTTVKNKGFETTRVQMVNTLKQFGFLAGAFSLLLWYLLLTLVILPLRRLYLSIDTLKRDDVLISDSERQEYFPVEEFSKIRNSLYSYHSDLTKSTTALSESEARKQAIFDNVVDGIITFNSAGEIDSHNPAAASIFGYKGGELLNMRFIELIEKSSQKDYADLINKGIARTNYISDVLKPSELIASRSDGSNIPIDLAVSKVQVDNGLIFIALIRDISERKISEQKLIFLANYDTLTKLPNRTLLKDRIPHAMALADREERLIGLLFLDLDRFKTINDTLGHHAGDLLLKAVANRLRSNTRESDTIARLGGDEFTIVMESIHHVDEALSMAEKLCEIFAEPFQVLDQHVFVTTSIGITIYPFDDTDTDNLLKNADIAMYRAKENGGGSYAFYEPQMNANATTWLTLENNLRNALERKEFHICYQPRIDVNTGKVVGMEALLRWHHEDHGLVSPIDFIPMLEETGLIVSVGEWVLRTAVKQNVEWQKAGFPCLRMSVNLSTRQFRHNDLLASINNILDETSMAPKWLELEITESMLVDNVSMATTILQNIHELGIHISVDDFGTGYSSLSYLKRFSIDTLKIDRAFVKDITTDLDDAAIASAIVALAGNLNLSITAEGVETVEQLEYLKNLGCDEAQGFLFGRPMETAEFEQWLVNYNKKLKEKRSSESGVFYHNWDRHK